MGETREEKQARKHAAKQIISDAKLWRKTKESDVKRAEEIAESDPEGALELLEKYPAGATSPFFAQYEIWKASSKLADKNHATFLGTHIYDAVQTQFKLSDMRVDLYRRCGRPEAAAAEQAAITPVVEPVLQELDLKLAAAESPDAWDIYRKGQLLDRIGRRSDGARCRLFAADMLLAKSGDPGAKASLVAAATAAGAAGTLAPVLGVVRGAGAGLEAFDGFMASYRYNQAKIDTGLAQSWRDELLREGRAVGLAHCGQCGGVVQARHRARRCVADHKVDEIRVVVMEDAPAAWYRDPWRRFTHRWWDGQAWTSNVARDGTPAEDPPGPSPPATAPSE